MRRIAVTPEADDLHVCLADLLTKDLSAELLRLLGKLGTRRDFVQSTLDLPFSDPPTSHHDAKQCRKVIEILQRIVIE